MAYTAFAIFKKQCKELQKEMFPKELLDEELLNQKCTERWKTMSEKEKRWFIYLEIEGRKSSSYSSRRPDPYPSHKTSTPISKIEQAIGFKKRFNSGGTRKL